MKMDATCQVNLDSLLYSHAATDAGKERIKSLVEKYAYINNEEGVPIISPPRIDLINRVLKANDAFVNDDERYDDLEIEQARISIERDLQTSSEKDISSLLNPKIPLAPFYTAPYCEKCRIGDEIEVESELEDSSKKGEIFSWGLVGFKSEGELLGYYSGGIFFNKLGEPAARLGKLSLNLPARIPIYRLHDLKEKKIIGFLGSSSPQDSGLQRIFVYQFKIEDLEGKTIGETEKILIKSANYAAAVLDECGFLVGAMGR